MRTRKYSVLGFTLIELMITVGILAILARIGYASYMKSVISANRSDATTALMNWSQVLERCFTQNFYYQSSSNDCSAPTANATYSANKYYLITATRTATTYTLTATPVSGTIQSRDSSCTSFTVDNTGTRGSSPSAASVCWGSN